MLFLVFELGTDRYALEVRQIAEVLPLLETTGIPGAPPAIAGLLAYRGALIPVIDLVHLTIGRPAARRLSTRIVLVHYPDQRGGVHLLGVIVERATQAIRRDRADFVPSGVTPPGTSYLGGVATDARGVLQAIDVGSLLPSSLRALLFNEPARV